jgi:carboxyl-terminal processing protease
MGDMLVAEGKTILQVEYRSGEKQVYRADKGDKVGLPMVVVIDGGSASAAEIMAGFLKESASVPLVGQKSFGKGTVQTAKDFDDGSNIKYTTAKWLTPNGNWIHQKGIEPDYKVELPKYAELPYLDPDKELKPETFSNEIKTAQIMLEALGHYPGRDDGFFDQKTKDAVIAFQKEQKLEPTGIISGKTTYRMIELLQEKIKKNDTQLEAAEKVLRKMIQ